MNTWKRAPLDQNDKEEIKKAQIKKKRTNKYKPGTGIPGLAQMGKRENK